MTTAREERFFDVVLELAGVTAGGDEDAVVEMLLAAGDELLGADGATVLLADARGDLRVAGSSGESSRLLAQTGLLHVGPAQLAHRGVHVVSFVADDTEAWRRYSETAQRLEIRLVHAVPIVVGEHSLGVFTLHWHSEIHLSEADERFARSLGRMAAVGIVNRRQARQRDERVGQLQHALDSRVVIEQAKGVLAAQAGIDPTSAFELIRVTARATGRRLCDVADEVVQGVPTEMAQVRRSGSADPPRSDRGSRRERRRDARPPPGAAG